MTTIRHLRREDLARLVPLHRKAFGEESTLTDDAMIAHLGEVFLDGPWVRASESDSLVCVDERENAVGFLGVFRSEWTFDGRACPVAITSQFMVDPDRAPGTAAIELMRRVMSGGFDLVLADGSASGSRRVWSALGGDTLYLASLEWIRPLAPVRHLSDVVLQRARRWSKVRGAAALLAAAPDAVAARVRPNRFHEPVAGIRAEGLTDDGLAEHREEFARRYRLAPRYSGEQLSWLFGQLRQRRRHGDLRAVLLRDAGNRVVGWYLYHWRRGVAARVVEAQSAPSARETVLRHLFRDAWLRGATSVTGATRPDLVEALGELWCYFRRSGPWTIAYSPRPDIRLALHSGDAWFSRLDVEDWMRFIGEPRPAA